MTKDVRLSVRVAGSGADAIDKIADDTRSDRSKVTREFLSAALASPVIRKEVVTRLKQRKGIE